MSKVSKKKKSLYVVLSVLLLLTLGVTIVIAQPGIDPTSVNLLIFPGESANVEKTVGTPEFPPMLDVCLLQDETGSFGDDIGNMNAAASGIYDSIVATAPNSNFGVHGFRDYGDAWVHRNIIAMSPAKANWTTGISALTASGGGDFPEAQYDAIVAATQGGAACEWRADPDVTRVLLVSTDATFHGPGGSYVNGFASTSAALIANNVTLIGLKAPGAGGELDALAAAMGGNVQPLSSNSDNIANAILAGLSNLPALVVIESDCTAPISTSFNPASSNVTSGDNAQFLETIGVVAGAAGGTYSCTDWATVNGENLVDESGELITEDKTIHVPGIDLTPETDTNELGFDLDHTVVSTVSAGDYGPLEGVRVDTDVTAGPQAGASGSGLTDVNGEEPFTYTPAVAPSSLGTDTIEACFKNADGSVNYGCDTATKEWVDTTPPEAFCLPSVNPDGTEPNAPGNGGQGQNQDGFYGISAEDVVWPADSLELFVTDSGTGTAFGPFPTGTNIKYVEANGAPPKIRDMSKSGDGYVDWMIRGQGDAVVTAVDGSGNVSDGASCLVPPPPK